MIESVKINIHDFSWLSRPIIQHHKDINIQKLIWDLKPDLRY